MSLSCSITRTIYKVGGDEPHAAQSSISKYKMYFYNVSTHTHRIIEQYDDHQRWIILDIWNQDKKERQANEFIKLFHSFASFHVDISVYLLQPQWSILFSLFNVLKFNLIAKWKMERLQPPPEKLHPCLLKQNDTQTHHPRLSFVKGFRTHDVNLSLTSAVRSENVVMMSRESQIWKCDRGKCHTPHSGIIGLLTDLSLSLFYFHELYLV